MPSTVTVYTRQTLTISDTARLISTVRALHRDPHAVPGLDDPATATHDALTAALIEHGVDELAERAGEYGLVAGGSATVIVSGDGLADQVWPGGEVTPDGR